MSENNNTGCGCPCNNNNTRNESLDLIDGVNRLDSGDDRFESGVIDILCRIVSSLDRRVSILDGTAAGGCESIQVGLKAHNSSPVVAESEAVTSDAPAMTVQENTGAGAVSPSAPAQPRFVRLGASVYDRKLDRFLVAVNEAGARSIADELNVCPDRVVDFKWEDAK